jgi:signal transduction histidine kinase
VQDQSAEWSLIDHIPDQIVILGQSGQILAANKAWTDFGRENGIPADYSWIGVNYLDVCDKAGDYAFGGVKYVAEGLRSILSGKLKKFEQIYPCHSSTESRWFNLQVVLLYGHPRARLMVQHIELDHSDGAPGTANLGMVNHLAAALAHEINQPLSAALNWMGALRATLHKSEIQPEPKFNRFIESAIEEVKFASAIVRDLRKFVARSEIDASLVSINGLIERAVTTIKPAADRAKVTIALSLAPDLPGVWADGVQIQQVVINIVRNAIEALEKMAERRVRIATLLVANDMVEVSIHDSGPGISEEILKSAFQPFVSTKKSGLGLGLSISQTIIQNHGGQISVSSDENSGSTFRFKLPIADREQKISQSIQALRADR